MEQRIPNLTAAVADSRMVNIVTKELRKALTEHLFNQAEAELTTIFNKYRESIRAEIEKEVSALAITTVSELVEHLTGDKSVGVVVKFIK